MTPTAARNHIGKMVLVTWVDSVTSGHWQPQNHLASGNLDTECCGFLSNVGEDRLVVSCGKHQFDGEAIEYCGNVEIPLVAVKKLRRVK